MKKLEVYLNKNAKGVRTFHYLAGGIVILLMLSCIYKTLFFSSMSAEEMTLACTFFLAFIGVGVRIIQVGRDSYRKQVA